MITISTEVPIKICPYCLFPFISLNPTKLYCCNLHMRLDKQIERNEMRKRIRKENRETGSDNKELHPLIEISCPGCGKIRHVRHPKYKYCSQKCRSRVLYETVCLDGVAPADTAVIKDESTPIMLSPYETTMTPIKSVVCKCCGKVFIPTAKNRFYCIECKPSATPTKERNEPMKTFLFTFEVTSRGEVSVKAPDIENALDRFNERLCKEFMEKLKPQIDITSIVKLADTGAVEEPRISEKVVNAQPKSTSTPASAINAKRAPRGSYKKIIETLSDGFITDCFTLSPSEVMAKYGQTVGVINAVKASKATNNRINTLYEKAFAQGLISLKRTSHKFTPLKKDVIDHIFESYSNKNLSQTDMYQLAKRYKVSTAYLKGILNAEITG